MKKIATILFVCGVLFSCTNKPLDQNREDYSTIKTLHKRSNQGSIILNESISPNISSLRFGEDGNPIHNLGICYFPKKGIMGDERCLGDGPVFRMEDFYKENKGEIGVRPVRQLEIDSYAFSSSETLTNYIKRNFEASTSANIDFSPFSFGFSHSFSQSFSMNYTFSSKRTYAVANIEYLSKKYYLTPSALTYNKLTDEYYSPHFLANLYNTPIATMFSGKYGYSNLLINKFYAGGKAELLFVTDFKDARTEMERNDSVKTAINASILNKGGGSISFNGASIDKKSYSENISSMRLSLRVQGGQPHSSMNIPVQEAKNVSLNFSPWITSLHDENTHRLISFPENPFLTLDQFIREENIRKRISDPRLWNGKFITPKIEIHWGEYPILASFGEPLKNIYAVLRTRYGDYIQLRPYKEKDETYWTASTEDEFNKKAMELKNYFSKYYDMDIVQVINRLKATPLSTRKIPPYSQDPSDIFYTKSIALSLPLFGIQESKMVRCQHPHYYKPEQGMYIQYLLFDGGAGKQYAFSIYKEWILDTYGIRSIFEKAPKVTKTMDELNKYKIIAL